MPDDTALTDLSIISPDQVRLHRRLTDQLDRSERQLVGLESVLTDMNIGHDTIQEDRDGMRLVVDGIRDDLRRIKSALTRLEAGTYGRCVNCGSMIAPERLDAIPSADHCTRCA